MMHLDVGALEEIATCADVGLRGFLKSVWTCASLALIWQAVF